MPDWWKLTGAQGFIAQMREDSKLTITYSLMPVTDFHHDQCNYCHPTNPETVSNIDDDDDDDGDDDDNEDNDDNEGGDGKLFKPVEAYHMQLSSVTRPRVSSVVGCLEAYRSVVR